MDTPKRIPWSVRIVAYLFALGGILHMGGSLIGWFVGSLEGNLLLDLIVGIAEIYIAAGLLELNRVWRFIALAWIVVKTVYGVTIGAVGLFLAPSVMPATLRVGSWIHSIALPKLMYISLIWAFTIVICGLQWWALDRPSVRRLFIQTKRVPEVLRNQST